MSEIPAIYLTFTTCENCLKSVHIYNFSGPNFPAYGRNTEIYRVNLFIQSDRGKIWTTKSHFSHGGKESSPNLCKYTKALTQSTFTYSKLTIETLEQGVKYVQS